MRVRAALLVLTAGSVAWAASASAGQVVPLHEATVSKAITGTIHSVVVKGDAGSIAIVAGTHHGLRAHESWNFEQPTISYTLRHGKLTVSTNCNEQQKVGPSVTVEGFNDCSLDLTLTVPSAADLTVSNPYGDVSVAGVSGAITLRADTGSVAVKDVRHGALDASSGYGEVSADRVSATAFRLRSDNGSVSARSVRAPVVTASSGYGSVTAEDLSAPIISLHSDNGDVSATSVHARQLGASSQYGTVTLTRAIAPFTLAHSDNGSVHLTRVDSRTIQASSSYGDVTLAHVRASDVLARSDNGSLQVALSAAPTNASVSTAYGDATLAVPAGRYAVSATSSYGDAKIDGLTVDPEASRLLSVHSDNGNVLVESA